MKFCLFLFPGVLKHDQISGIEAAGEEERSHNSVPSLCSFPALMGQKKKPE